MTKKTLLTGLVAASAVSAVGLQADQYGYSKGSWNTGFGYNNCCPSNEFYAEVDFLYWNAKRGFPSDFNFDFNDTGINFFFNEEGPFPISPTPSTLTILTAAINLDHERQKWKPGFRIAAGWVTACDLWDLGVVWTHLHTNDHHRRRFRAPGEETTSFGRPTRSSNYDTLDLELGRDFRPACKVALRPFISIRGAWFERKGSTSIHDLTTFVTPQDEPFIVDQFSRFHHKFETQAYGPRIGMDSTWGEPCGFSLYGNFSAALLYGRHQFRLHTDHLSAFQIEGGGAFESETRFFFRERDWHLIPTLQVALGIAWGHQFDCGSLFRVTAGWETNVYWEAENVAIFERSLSLQGLTVGVGYDF